MAKEKLAVTLGFIVNYLGLVLSFVSFVNRDGIAWEFFATLGVGLWIVGAYIAFVNYRIILEDTN